jgi:tryptophanyl-tRNA synthetase
LTTATKRVLSGMRPTGRLHVGHYFGALQNWVRLQDELVPATGTEDPSAPLATRHSPLPANDCFYFIADWHALTSDYADTSAVAENSLQITIDYLAAGLDPNKSVIFLQSRIPEHAELHLLLSMITPLGWLERIPTYKEALDNITNKDLHTYGFLGYPTLQTADIVMYSDPGKSLFVPVGEDQVSHVEFSRELVRRFNLYYSLNVSPEIFTQQNRKLGRNVLFKLLDIPANEPILSEGHELSAEQRTVATAYIRQRVLEMGLANFLEKLPPTLKPFFTFTSVLTEPDALLTPTPRIPGLDGRKMSKSYNNAITLSESDADIRSKTKVMVTDPARKRRTDPGNPDVCPVYDWHKLFSPKETLDWAAEGCRTAAIGCIECKAAMADDLIKWIAPIRARRVEYEQDPKRVLEILDAGSAKARESAKQTMSRVRESIFNWQRKRQEMPR